MSIEETIDAAIEELIGQIAGASQSESARIHTRIAELESLKKKHATT